MKAIRLHPNPDTSNPYSPANPAPASALKLDTDLAPPSDLDPGELLIKVEATTVVRDMLTWPESYLHEYQVLGNDFAGTVVKTAASSSGQDTTFKAGDHVFGMIDASRSGAWSEYAVVKEDEAYLKPDHLPWPHAAAIPLTGLTAYQALFVHAGIPPPSSSNLSADTMKKGDSILVTGATGSVGLYLVQLAKLAGLHVIAATRTPQRNQDFLTRLGADEVVDYDTAFSKRSERYRVIIDTVGGLVLEKCWSAVGDGGVIISVDSSSYDFVQQHQKSGLDGGRSKDVTAKFFIVTSSQQDLKSLSAMLDAQMLESFVACVLPLTDIQQAYEQSETGSSVRGKVVLKVGDFDDATTSI